MHFLRILDFKAAQLPQFVIANSNEVKGRIEKFYRRTPIVVYPPVEIPEIKGNVKKQNYYLIGGRVSRHKGHDIAIKAFNVEYYALEPNTVADVVTGKETIENSGMYHLTSFTHDLAKILSIKVNGEVTITFAMDDLERKKQYLIEIKYTHNRDGGIKVFNFKANNRESSTNINNVKINKSIIKPKEWGLFNNLRASAPQNFPPELFMKLIYVIFYSLKGVLKTSNYENQSKDNTIKQDATGLAETNKTT
jgi:hypothetical protein